MSQHRTRFSLKKKITILIIFIIVAIILMAGLFCYRGLTDSTRVSYVSRSEQLAATTAAILDPLRVKHVHDQVMEIYHATPMEERVSSEDWGSPEFEEYLKRYEAITETEDYRLIHSQLRMILDCNHLQAAYLICFDTETESTIYLVDGSYEDVCLPGCFDPVMYDVDHEAMKHPENGIAADVTNTEEYGWVVAAGSPIFADGELVAFAAADISMNEVMAERNRFLTIAFVALLVLALVAIIISIFLIDRTIIRPINKLSDTSKKYWNGETSEVRHEFSQLNIHTGDELETLSDSMKQMEQNINEHITKLLETTRKLISTRELADEMDRMANIDALTKVRNKRAYDLEIARLDQEIQNGKTACGLAMIDLNYLKQTNDTYGHEKGNEILQLLCQTICFVFKHSPVFRVGGDEFVVILENHDYEHLEELKEQFEQELQRLRDSGEPISAAAGYALYDPAVDRNIESVFQRADALMYERKKQMKAERA